MDKATSIKSHGDTVLTALENALDDLVASISAYNPSPAAADLVVQADINLSYYLEELTQHQRNFQLIQQLRSTSEALDERTKTTLNALTDLRHELINSTPVSLPPDNGKSASLDSNVLLKFAQQIARSTIVPPRGIASAISVGNDAPLTSVETSIKIEPGTPQMSNGVDADSSAEAPLVGGESAASQEQGKAISSLDPSLRAWLASPTTQTTFVPWIAEEQSRKSALSRIEEA